MKDAIILIIIFNAETLWPNWEESDMELNPEGNIRRHKVSEHKEINRGSKLISY